MTQEPEQTRNALYKQAQQQEIAGRSSMSKAELAAALERKVSKDAHPVVGTRVNTFRQLAESVAAEAFALRPRILTGFERRQHVHPTLHYDPAIYFVMSVDLPAAGVVRSSETGAPYLAVSLSLDATLLAGLISELPNTGNSAEYETGFPVAAVTPELLDAWVRMLRLMKQPADIPALAPAYEREILYRVLQGPMV